MTLAVWHKHITDENGSIVDDATITVRREAAGAQLADLYSDREGSTPKSNPFTITAGDDGFAEFFAVGGAYRVQVVATATGASRTWRYEAVGTAAETDAGVIEDSLARYMWDDATADADPGSGFFRLNSGTFASVTAIYIDDENIGAEDISAWLNTFDDFGGATSRGLLEIIDPVFPTTKFAMFRVTGSVVDGPGYKKLTVTPLTASDATISNILTDDLESSYVLRFFTTGPSGTLTAVQDDLTPTLGGNLNANGHDINMPSGSELNLNNGGRPLSTGLHTIYVDAGGMEAPTFGGAASTKTELTASAPIVVFRSMDFDQNNEEESQFKIGMPKSWNGGTFLAEFIWTAASGAGSVVWSIALAVRSEGDAIEQAFGTQIEVTDTLTTAGDVHVSDDTAAITAAGTPADDSVLFGRITREVTNASDTLTADAKLLGIRIFMTLDLPNDA